MSVLSKESTLAGVSASVADPFVSMEINDQVNGVNGGINGTVPLSSNNGNTVRITRKANETAGVINLVFDYLTSR